MTSPRPREEQLDWAVGVVLDAEAMHDSVRGETSRDGAEVEVRPLREDGAPWLITVRRANGPVASAVLRVAAPQPDAVPSDRERAGMSAARRAGIPVPAVLGERRDADADLLLIEYVSGSSALPRHPDRQRLREIGAIAARLFTSVDVHSPEVARLPVVEHPIPLVDFAALRADAQPQPLLVEAERRAAETDVDDPLGFVHGDFWSGNTLWNGGTLAAVLDWDCCGRGVAGIDLGSLRCDAAMCYGGDAADEVLAGWEAAAARPADSVAYWDAVAGLSTPPDISWFAPAISGMTKRPDLTGPVLRERRDAFLTDALRRLG